MVGIYSNQTKETVFPCLKHWLIVKEHFACMLKLRCIFLTHMLHIKGELACLKFGKCTIVSIDPVLHILN